MIVYLFIVVIASFLIGRKVVANGFWAYSSGLMVVIGLMLYVCVASFVVVYVPRWLVFDAKSFAVASLIVIVVFCCYSFRDRNVYYLLYRSELWSLIFLTITYSVYGLDVIRFHTNPDIYGMAAATGFFRQEFSLHSLQDIYKNFTGLKEAIWLPTTPKLESIWFIPSQQVRFGADLVIGSGRIGLPVLTAIGISLVEPIKGYASFVMMLGIMGVWSIGLFSIYIVRGYERLLKADTGNNADKTIIGNALILIVCMAPWCSIMVLEGSVAQIWFLSACLMQVANLLGLIVSDDKSDIWRWAIMTAIPPLFIYYVYPFGLPMLILMEFPYFVMLMYSGHKRIVKYLSIGSIISIALFMYDKNRVDTTGQASKMFVSGAVGGGYHLGVVTVSDLLMLSGGKIRFGMNGFDGLATSNVISIIELVVIGAAIALSFMLMYRLGGEWRLRSVLIATPLVLLYFMVVITLRMLLLPEVGGFNDYVYARHMMNIIGMAFPVIFGVFYGLYRKRNAVGKLVYVLIMFCVVFSLYGYSKLVDNYVIYTKDFFSVDNTAAYVGTYRRSLVFSEKPEQSVTALSLYGPTYYMTDNWGPVIDGEGEGYRVFNLVQVNGVGHLKYAGVFKVNGRVNGPITYDQFIQNKNVQYVPL